MPKNAEQHNLVGVAEAARITGLDRRTLHRKVERGELAAVGKLEGKTGAYIFNRADIEALIPPAPAAPATPRPGAAGASSSSPDAA